MKKTSSIPIDCTALKLNWNCIKIELKIRRIFFNNIENELDSTDENIFNNDYLMRLS